MSKSVASGGLSQFASTVTLASGVVDWSQGNVFSHSISANTTYSFLNNTDGRTIVLKISNTSGSSVTLTWPANTIGTDTTIAASTTKVFSLVQVGVNTYCENPTAASSTPSGRQLFTSSSSFTVPVGVSTIYVSGTGGGGGGGSTATPSGSGGGTTSLGALMSLAGGVRAFSGGSSGGAGGAAGYQLKWSTTVDNSSAGVGGGTIFGVGSKSAGSGYGVGGGAVYILDTIDTVSGGGGGAAVISQSYSVTSGTIYTITIGAGGSAGASGTAGSSGFLLIEW
jgi:hypothetical protein